MNSSTCTDPVAESSVDTLNASGESARPMRREHTSKKLAAQYFLSWNQTRKKIIVGKSGRMVDSL